MLTVTGVEQISRWQRVPRPWDADHIEEHAGVPPEELTDEELVAAMEELGIQSIELTDDDQAIIEEAG